MLERSLAKPVVSPRRSTLAHREWLVAMVFLLPNIIGFLVFEIGPVFAGFFLSLTKWNLLTRPQFIGFRNYAQVLQDPLFLHSLKNTLWYSVLVIPIGIVMSLALALAMNTKIHGISVYRAIYFIPVISSMVAVSMVWRWFYNAEFGVVNAAIGLVGIPPQNWLNDPRLALPAIAAMSIWKGMGYNMVIFLAGLQGIPAHLYEAAEIDGAHGWSRFRHITLPLLSPSLFFVSVLSVIGSFQVFDSVYLMTSGGPGNATLVYSYYLYQNAFVYLKMGYASAMAYVLFLLILAVTLLQVRWLGRRTQYDLA